MDKGEIMENNLIMFSNTTSLMKAKELLRQNNIRSRTVRTPARLRNGSCGYSLQINKDFEKAFELIRSRNIKVLGASAVDWS